MLYLHYVDICRINGEYNVMYCTVHTYNKYKLDIKPSPPTPKKTKKTKGTSITISKISVFTFNNLLTILALA